jgi:hypothetical protein
MYKKAHVHKWFNSKVIKEYAKKGRWKEKVIVGEKKWMIFDIYLAGWLPSCADKMVGGQWDLRVN